MEAVDLLLDHIEETTSKFAISSEVNQLVVFNKGNQLTYYFDLSVLNPERVDVTTKIINASK